MPTFKPGQEEAPREYDALRARAGIDAGENAMTTRIVTATAADANIPDATWAAIERGENVFAALRAWRGLTQEEVAEATGLAQGFVSAIETGEKRPGRLTFQKLAKAYRLPDGEMLQILRPTAAPAAQEP